MIELIFSAFLLIGSHEIGHQVEADKLNLDLKWQGTKWSVAIASKKEVGLITNAAFAMQDEIGYRTNNKKFDILNGIHKTQYLFRDVLDMDNITDESKAFIALSAVSNFTSNGLRFIQYNDNTSGLIKTWRF
ncbi:hypothetical protein KAR91_37395 [Candidatus Pacearchaeota archaeon]|nr:hypothetical protein [Candidatus Pacearchaeota archaeon]